MGAIFSNALTRPSASSRTTSAIASQCFAIHSVLATSQLKATTRAFPTRSAKTPAFGLSSSLLIRATSVFIRSNSGMVARPSSILTPSTIVEVRPDQLFWKAPIDSLAFDSFCVMNS